MTTSAAAPQTSMGARRRWPIVIVLVLGVATAAIWAMRAAYWPCGALDKVSHCVSSVVLDVSALGLDPGSTHVEDQGLDLGPGGTVALIALKARTGTGWHFVLAAFDARTGQLLRTLAEGTSTDAEPYIMQSALSSDGALAAAIITQTDEEGQQTALNVYRVSDGSLVRTIWTVTGSERVDCALLLDFSPDGRKVQCFTKIHDLESGAVTSIADAQGDFRYPIYAAVSAMDAVASDGTRVNLSDLKSDIVLYDSDRWARFAPDSTGVLVLARAYKDNRGQRLFTPPVFRRMAALEIWDGKSGQFQRGFVANRRYLQAAWSQDSAQVGLISADLHLDVFER